MPKHYHELNDSRRPGAVALTYLHRGGDDVAVDDRVGFVGTADLHFLYARSNVNFRCDQAVVDTRFCADWSKTYV